MRPDLDAIEALSPEREALWSRIDKATFLTANEKRAAIGYGPVDAGDAIKGLSDQFDGDAAGDLSYKYPAQPRIPAGQREGGQFTLGRFRFRPPAGPKPAPGFGATPKGLKFTKHGRDQATARDFTEQRIDAIVENNARTRVGKVDLDGKKTWEYRDTRGNTVVLNEEGGIVTVYSPGPESKHIPKP